MTPEQPKQPASLSVVVPVYNEEGTLAAVVEKLLALPHLLEVVVVDDCSTDRTPEVARRLADAHPQVRLARHERNRGKTEKSWAGTCRVLTVTLIDGTTHTANFKFK